VGKRDKGEVINGVAYPRDFTGRKGEYWGRSGDLGERAEN